KTNMRSPLFPYTTLFRSKFVITVRDTVSGKPTANEMVLPDPVNGFFRARFIPGSTDLLVQSKFEVARWDTATGNQIGDVCRFPRSEEHTSELQSLAYLVC